MTRLATRSDLRTLESIEKKPTAIRDALGAMADIDGVKEALAIVDHLDGAITDVATDIEMELNECYSQKGRYSMRYGPDHKFWIVTDPKPSSSLGDILFQASLKDLELQFKGGLTIDENPTLFTEKEEADAEAQGRLVAMRASEAITRNGAGAELRNATHIKLLNRNGAVVLQLDL